MPKYIDAEKFAEQVSENLSWNGERYNAASVISDLKTCPAADVEPVRHGRWEYDSDHIPHCSECGTMKRALLNFQVEACFMDVMEAMDRSEKLWNRRAGDDE